METQELRDLYPPEREVRLVSGECVTITPWGIKDGMYLLPKVLAIFERMEGNAADVSVAAIIHKETPEVVDVICRTLGWTAEELDQRVKFEDVFSLAQAILETCILRGDGGGAAGKMIGLGTSLLVKKGAPSPRPSNS